MNIYVVDYWEPFPESEYGGVVVVIAEDSEQCVELLLRNFKGKKDLIYIAVAQALRYPLSGTHSPSIVKAFLT